MGREAGAADRAEGEVASAGRGTTGAAGIAALGAVPGRGMRLPLACRRKPEAAAAAAAAAAGVPAGEGRLEGRPEVAAIRQEASLLEALGEARVPAAAAAALEPGRFTVRRPARVGGGREEAGEAIEQAAADQ